MSDEIRYAEPSKNPVEAPEFIPIKEARGSIVGFTRTSFAMPANCTRLESEVFDGGSDKPIRNDVPWDLAAGSVVMIETNLETGEQVIKDNPNGMVGEPAKKFIPNNYQQIFPGDPKWKD